MTATEPTDGDHVAPLEERCEWSRDTLEGGYVWRLGPDEQRELEAALAHARARTAHVLDITRDDFPLPTLGARLAVMAEDLIDGRGVALLRGLDLTDLSPDDASAIYWGVGTHLGRPWPQNAKGHLLGDVTDQGRRHEDPTSRGNELGGVGLPFHSDGSDVVGLFCLDAGVEGGESLVANALMIHNELARTEPGLAAALYDDFAYDYRGEEGPGQRPWYTMPVFIRHHERLFTRYIRPYMRSVRRHRDAPLPSEQALAAMDRLDAMCADPAYHVSMRLEPGDMQFINNYHVLHGRAPYRDAREVGAVRHLKRLWLETRVLTDDDKPERYRMSASAASWWKAAERARGAG
ncbi:MAG: TauD/TfdA family dioxygenase [Actinomycetota bacterium]|nr:TauD/TfdA family dioxygenase [Actinomycetota bacterium]